MTPAPTTTTTTGTENPDLGYAALCFGFLAILLVLLFIRWDRHQTLEIQERLASEGLPTAPQNVPAGDGGRHLHAVAGSVVVDGPNRLKAGATADFVARQDGTQVSKAWSADPPDVLHVPAEATSRLTVTALKAGTATLTPQGGIGKQIVVTAPSRRPMGLLFVGDDWGHVVVAIVLASITAALGLAGALSGEAVATLLGALVGYVVARSQSGGVGGRRPPPAQPAQATPLTATTNSASGRHCQITGQPAPLMPPPWRPEPAGHLARRTGMSGRQLRVLARAAAALAVLALAGCAATVAPAAPARTHVGAPPIASRLTGRIEPLTSFLTVTTSPPVTRGTGLLPLLVRYPVATLQLRSIRTGRVIATLLRSLGSIGAVMTRSGSVIAVLDYGCRSEVLRIDPQTDRSTLIRVLPQSADHPALSPDGSQLAYLTYPASQRHSCDPARQPVSPVREEVNPGGPVQFLPNVVAVVNLATGATVRAATSNPGQPPSSPAWSPDGATIAVTSLSDRSIVLLSAAHPDFASAPQIRARPGCAYSAVTWIAQGLVAVCNRRDPALPPYQLVRLSLAGRQTASWRLPGCIDGIEPFADPMLRHVLVEAYIGYGNGPPCGVPHPGVNSLRIMAIRGSALDTVTVFGQRAASQLAVTGW